MNTLNKIYCYCRDTIESFAEKEALALANIDRMRCPLNLAAPQLYDEMEGTIYDWAEYNGYSVDFYESVDVEEVFMAGDGR